jgi:hypothetical protein
MRVARIHDFCLEKLDESIREILADEGIHPEALDSLTSWNRPRPIIRSLTMLPPSR